MKFEEMFKAKQVEMEMNHAQFAKYIGRHRTWVMDLWNPENQEDRFVIPQCICYIIDWVYHLK